MSTYTQILYHIVFSTKNRQQTLKCENKEDLFKYIWGIIRNKNCHLYRVNGTEDHVHILTHLHPSLSLADLVKDIKLGTHDLIKRTGLIPGFKGWQEGYGGFTVNFRDRGGLIEYIANQEIHHKKKTFEEEFLELLNEHGVAFDRKYLFH